MSASVPRPNVPAETGAAPIRAPSWFGSLVAFVTPPAAVLLGAFAPLALALPALASGIERKRDGRGRSIAREPKLWLCAVGLVASIAALGLHAQAHPGEIVRALGWIVASLLLVPAYLFWARSPPSTKALAAGLAVAAATGVAIGALPWRSGSEAPAAGHLQGAIALSLIPPAWHFARAARHRYPPLHRTGHAGLALVAVFAVAQALGPAFAAAETMCLYLVAVALLYAETARREREHYARPVERAMTLGVSIIAKNEADRIGGCLASVSGWADEIVVLDSGSTDETVAIARRYTDRVWITDWPGYGPQKQRALERVTTDWVLSIDADEELTPELRHDIDSALGPAPVCVAYELPWGVVAFGKLLDFGRSARAPLRLFRREGSRFTDAQVHETIVPPPGRVGRLRGRLLHYTQRDYGHAAAKVAHYGWLGAQKRFEAGRRGGGLVGASVRAVATFLHVGIVRGGLLDGPAGFVTAVHYGRVTFDKYAGLWALRRDARARRSR